jgi:predicted metal-dependent peptidase
MNVAVAIDTSGSMSANDLSRAVTEFDEIFRAVCPAEGIVFLSVDAEVHVCERLSSICDIDLVGGGGTNMGKAIELVEREFRQTIDVLIIFTDGETPWPAEPHCGFEVLVFIVGDRKHFSIPDWLHVITHC